jgi:hypothetical protein
MRKEVIMMSKTMTAVRMIVITATKMLGTPFFSG